MSSKLQRKGRTLMMTIEDLIESPRFNIALEMYKEDPMLLKAILVELGMEAQNVAKYRIISETMKYHSLDKGELKRYLSQVNEFNKYNIYWGMSDLERLYYSKNPKGELGKREARQLFRKLKKQFGLIKK